MTQSSGAGIVAACSSADVAAFLAACTGTGDCAGWQAANAPSSGMPTTCGQCILPETSTVASDGSLLWAPTNWGATYAPPFSERLLPNIGLCVGWLDPSNGATCAAAWDNLINCLDAACSACALGAENDTCEEYAYQTGGCSALATAYSSACAPDLEDGGALNTCVAGGNVTAQYELVIDQTCGPEDGGTDGGTEAGD